MLNVIQFHSLLFFLSIIVSIIVIIICINRTESTTNDFFEKLEKYHNNLKQLPVKNNLDVPIYYINLDKDKDRNMFLINMFQELHITNYVRISGIHYKNIMEDGKIKNENIIFQNINDYMIDGILGCTLSHLKAIKTSYNNNDDIALILEDDASLYLTSFLKKSIKEMSYNFPQDWEICILGHNKGVYYNNSNVNNVIKKNLSKHIHGTYSYLINKNGMKKIIENYFPNETIEIKKNNA